MKIFRETYSVPLAAEVPQWV